VKYSWKIGLPFILAAAVGALNATLPMLSAYRASTAAGATAIGVALLVGDALRAQLLIAENKQPPTPSGQPPAPIAGEVVALPALPLIDPGLLVALVERVLADHLAAASAPQEPLPPALQTELEKG
jgi:hypothetical protein